MKKIVIKLLLALTLLGSSLIPIVQTEILANGISVVTSTGSTTLERVPVVIDSQISVAFSGTIDGLLISIQNGVNGDVLASNNSSCSYVASTKVMTCNGSFTAEQAQAIFRSVTFYTTASDLTPRKIDFVLGKALPDPESGRFYEYFQANVTWQEALDLASQKTLFGLQGYLATIPNEKTNDFITSKINADPWVGGSDDYQVINAALGRVEYANQAAAEGFWYWVTGPEKGQMFYNHRTIFTSMYSNWASGEPNNVGFNGEHFLQLYSLNQGKWNDLPASSRLAYVVAYGGFDDDPVVQLMATKTVNILPVVSYFANGATSGEVPVDNENYLIGDTVTVLPNETLTKSNAVFLGWSPSNTGYPLYQAYDTFKLDGRTTLFAIWFSVEKYYESKNYGIGQSSVIVNYISGSDLFLNKVDVEISNFITGDELTTYYSSGQQSYWYYDSELQQWKSMPYQLTVTKTNQKITFESNIPIVASQFYSMFNSVAFQTSSSTTGIRNLTYNIHLSTEPLTLTSTINVVETYHVTYQSDKYLNRVPVDNSKYRVGQRIYLNNLILNQTDNPGEDIFVGWRDDSGTVYSINDAFFINKDTILTAVFENRENLKETNQIVYTNFASDVVFTLPEGYLESNYSWAINSPSYDVVNEVLILNKVTSDLVDQESISGFNKDIKPNLGQSKVMYLYIQPKLFYFHTSNSYPYLANFNFYGSNRINISFTLPQENRGTNYRLYYADYEDTYLIDSNYNASTGMISFALRDFNNYILVYDQQTDNNMITIPSPQPTIFMPVEVTLSLNTGGGRIIAPRVLLSGSELSLPTPIRPGYRFDGWYWNSQFSMPFISSIMPHGNVTLYAKWVLEQQVAAVEIAEGTSIRAKGLLEQVNLGDLSDVESVFIELVASSEDLPAVQQLARIGLTNNNLTLVEIYDIALFKTITSTNGSINRNKVNNEDILGLIEIYLPVPENYEADQLSVVFINDDGEVEILTSRVEVLEGITYLVFETDHFSYYGLVNKTNNELNPSLISTIPKTDGTNSWTFIWLSLALLMGMIELLIKAKRKYVNTKV